MSKENACVHLYTGEGKGKTTAGVGLATRALGQGLRVGFFQFMKAGLSGEVVSLAKLGATVVSPSMGTKFVWDMDDTEKAACATLQQETFARARQAAQDLDLLVLDEAISACDTGMLSYEEVAGFIQNRPKGLELALTGRGDIAPLLPLADYCTEMKLHAHPYEKGRGPRKGVEF